MDDTYQHSPPADATEKQSFVTHQLCADCRSFFGSWRASSPLHEQDDRRPRIEWEGGPTRYEKPFASVQLEASRGCHFCCILCEVACPTNRNCVGSRRGAHVDSAPSLDPAFQDRGYQSITTPESDCSYLDRRVVVERAPRSSGGGLLVRWVNDQEEPVCAKCGSRADLGISVVSDRFGCCEDTPHNLSLTRTNSSTSLAQIARWLSECAETHQECAMNLKRSETSRMPSFLLEITPCKGEMIIRLVRTSSLPARPAWVTLSHCWGQRKFLRTTTSNVKAHLDRIPVEQLPRTFRDAAELTLRLGQRYLWIDSLCIQQDSEAHWQQECEIMGDIYESSVFTIAALGGQDSAAGCFVTRNSLGLFPVHVEVQGRWSTGKPVQICISGEWPGPDGRHFNINPQRILGPSNYLNDYRWTEPLLTRAWTFQERLLPCRTIYFGTRTISYECLMAVAIPVTSTLEAKPLTLQRTRRFISGDPVGSTFKGMFRDQLLTTEWEALVQQGERASLSRDTIANWCIHYWTLISQYSSLHLSFSRDRLVAISGLLRRISVSTGFTSVAGLWKETFLLDLLWRRSNHRVQPVRSMSKQGSQRAPTWSWAFWDAPSQVKHAFEWHLFPWKVFGKGLRWTARLLDVTIAGNQSGVVTGGQAVLAGPIRPVEFDWRRYNQRGQPLKPEEEPRLCIRPKGRGWGAIYPEDHYDGFFTAFSPDDLWLPPDDRKDRKRGQPIPPPTSPVSSTTASSPPTDLWVLLIAVTFSNFKTASGHYPENTATGWGLVIQRTGRKTVDGADEWERVGLYQEGFPLDTSIVRYLQETWLHDSALRDQVVHIV